jgi:hypothetical protein
MPLRDQRAHADAAGKAHIGALPLLLDQHGIAQAWHGSADHRHL